MLSCCVLSSVSELCLRVSECPSFMFV
ncbi:rCG23775 [Rattus norvegicus]|uniref:RCG23775 n=1 Tax=Rattus norvegicus TaxID=10116 RepID=A6JWD5_RAT|nr:rCG23775 [Rattus norvegicus]